MYVKGSCTLEGEIKKKLNFMLMFRLMIVQVWIVIFYFPMLFIPFKLHFPFFYQLAIRFFLWAAKIKIVNLTEFDISDKCPAVFASNHKCFADPVFIARFIMKQFAFSMSSHVIDIVPPFRLIAWKMRFIGINKKNYAAILKSFDKIKKSVSDGTSVIYFPEGYYTIDKPVGTMRGGIAKIAKQTGSDIVPVAIYGIDQNFAYDSKFDWKNVYLKAGDSIKFDDFGDERKFVDELTLRIENLYYEIDRQVKSENV